MSILISVAAVSLLTVFLTILIILGETVLANYGVCTIDINHGRKRLAAVGGTTLLSALADHEIFVPSACGGKSTCGLCKIQVADNARPVLPTEAPYLTNAEAETGVRLACQYKIKSDLSVVIPEQFLATRRYHGRIERITDLTYDIKEFRLALPPGESLEFKAGQYIQVETKPYGNVKESVFRAYSIASQPAEQGYVDIIVRLVPNGICTTYLHKYVTVGDEISFTGPYGDFYLRDGADQLIFIAGGSGLAPIKSLIFDILAQQLDKNMIFFFGAVSKRDLYYVELFNDLAEKHENFTYIPALSKPEPDDDWDGELGLITEVVARHIHNGENKHAYLCGSPGMINACIEILSQIGFSSDQIFYDKF